MATSQVIANCDAPETIEVMAWYQAEGKDIVLEKPKRLAQRQLIGMVKDAEAEYATVQGVIMHIKEERERGFTTRRARARGAARR